ncbi:MAG: hypothetical protein EOP54_19415 [Sphingobacteriales bacterium]|nr:MAG: hypothetical protein EOP54_19415 [Sphingobacteriales bacterium]
MKILSLLTVCVVALASCTSNPDATNNDSLSTDSIATDSAENYATTGHICFLHTDGTAAQDSTMVHLIIDGDKVTGNMTWQPKEKDRRKGTLAGTQKGNTIKAVWSFMQEGMTDTIAVEFDFPGDKLAQKPLVFNQKTGREQTDAKAGYTVVFNKVDCK